MKTQKKKKAWIVIEIKSGVIYDVCPKKPRFKGDKFYKVIPCTINYEL